MPKYIPEWAYGRYRISAGYDNDYIVEEKFLFWWFKHGNRGFVYQYGTIDNAKKAIEVSIYEEIDRRQKINWRKNFKSIIWP